MITQHHNTNSTTVAGQSKKTLICTLLFNPVALKTMSAIGLCIFDKKSLESMGNFTITTVIQEYGNSSMGSHQFPKGGNFWDFWCFP